ncbi:Cyclopropane-fatty-acyl-phospholipid synthase [Aeoliella mucimassa]|uniref:Cyclopropane-fatty-acyl-phospholipid synthase n=1 Tax=Aeoliella mucimassa TaxID=2527972 RepID=A0A518ANI7_9BACT|nr:Cyclopropane-fatty-acyl-phospholipid synthase [Aeoliella mucimassa]
MLKRLDQLQGGRIVLHEGTNRYTLGQGDSHSMAAEIYVRQPQFYRRVLTGGSLGAAESYMDGDWATDDLPDLLSVFAKDWNVSCELNQGWRWWRKPLERTWNWLRRNTLAGSRKNIADHYDLSNEFYGLWLDETMNYSSGVFDSPESTLAEASVRKMDVVSQRLELKPTDHLLEIGTGWGALARHAAEQYGCRVTTTTISQQQYNLARERFDRSPARGRLTLLDHDYRELKGQFDKLVSIEMIEAVGHEYHKNFFRQCSDLLKPGGKMVLQAITIPDQRYDDYRRSVDFIQRYIFPGGALPSMGAIHRAVGQHTALLPVAVQDYGLHYARTLEAWRERFFDRIHEVRRLGFDDRFIRMWDYYLSYCIAGFKERHIGVVQMEFIKA